MTVTPTMYLIVLPLVFLAACIDAIGGGGGLISLPAYMVAGVPSILATGTNKCSASFGTFIATIKYLKSKKILMKAALCASAGIIPSAAIGAQIVSNLPENVVKIILLTVVPVMAVVLLIKRDAPDHQKEMTRRRLFYCFLTGVIIGLYDGIAGPGTGTLLIMGLTWICGMDTVTASGSAKLINLASNIAALTVHIIHGNVLFALAVPAMAVSAIGGYVGSALAIHKGAKFVRYVMLAVMTLLLIKLVLEYFI